VKVNYAFTREVSLGKRGECDTAASFYVLLERVK